MPINNIDLKNDYTNLLHPVKPEVAGSSPVGPANVSEANTSLKKREL